MSRWSKPIGWARMSEQTLPVRRPYHLMSAKNNGVTKTEIAEILTHAAFYAGWPKAWAAFRMAKDVWAEDNTADAKAKHQNEMVFPIGAPNDAFAKYFVGQSYLAPLSTQ